MFEKNRNLAIRRSYFLFQVVKDYASEGKRNSEKKKEVEERNP